MDHSNLRNHSFRHPHTSIGTTDRPQKKKSDQATNVLSSPCTSSSSPPSTSTSSFSSSVHSRVRAAYRRWARFVVAHPLKIMLFCFALTAICAVKMAKTKHKNNIRGYTPYGARALYEFDVRDEFFEQYGVGIRFFVLVLPRNGSNNNMLGVETLRETVEVNSLIQHNLTIFNRITQRNESFAQICRRFCTINEPVELFYVGFKDQQERLAKNESLNYRIQLDYPISTVFGRTVNIQPNFFGINFFNGSAPNATGSMESVEMVVLLYRAERIGGWSDDDISDYEMSVSRYFENHYSGQHIRVLTISTSYAQLEVDRSGNIIRSYVGLGLTAMVACSLLTNSFASLLMGQFSLCQLPVAVFACLCPFMASSTALGLLFLAGVRHGSVLGITPFLILAIGIDDAFLMIHSWRLASKLRRKNQGEIGHSNLDEQLSNQLAEVLEETGPAILISALTNICADFVGAFTSSPEITLLCVGNIASIIVDFFYQITLFTAVLVLCARWEFSRNAKMGRKTDKIFVKRYESSQQQQNRRIEEVKSSSSSNNSLKGQMNEFPVSRISSRGLISAMEHSFRTVTDLYIRFISSLFASLLICIVWLTFLVICFNAMLRFEINLTTRKLFPPDSPLLEIEQYREQRILPFYTTAQLFINAPGDLSNATRRHRLNALISEMEHLRYAYPRESSFYFIRNYEQFVAFMRDDVNPIMDEENSAETKIGERMPNEEDPFNFSELDTFLSWPEYRHWRGLLKIRHNPDPTNPDNNGTAQLDAFMAVVAYHGAQLRQWHERALMLQAWRRVVDKYSAEFNVSVLHDDGLYLDLLENMPTDIWQSALATLLCMSAICAIFMCNAFVVGITTGVIAFIFIETLGIMAMMGMTMDPVVMAAVIISVGFSVDMPAHLSYHFHAAKWRRRSDGTAEEDGVTITVEQRIRHAFASVGFPALQASTCTNVCVLSLLVVPLYMAQVFVRVLCVCITLCAVHSLCLLPALFSLVDSINTMLGQIIAPKEKKKKGKQTENSTQN